MQSWNFISPFPASRSSPFPANRSSPFPASRSSVMKFHYSKKILVLNEKVLNSRKYWFWWKWIRKPIVFHWVYCYFQPWAKIVKSSWFFTFYKKCWRFYDFFMPISTKIASEVCKPLIFAENCGFTLKDLVGRIWRRKEFVCVSNSSYVSLETRPHAKAPPEM